MNTDFRKWHLPKGSPIQRKRVQEWVSTFLRAEPEWESFITTKDAYYEYKDFVSTSRISTCINIPRTNEYDMIVVHPDLLIEL